MKSFVIAFFFVLSLQIGNSQVYIDYLNNVCPIADVLTVCIGTNNSYVGQYNYITYNNFCQDTIKGQTRISRNQAGEYFVEDFSFGTWGTCYGIEPPSGTLRLNIECNDVLGISGTDNYGDVWSSSQVIYTGNSIIISWLNTFAEFGTTELIPLDGRSLNTPESILEEEFDFLWSTGEISQTIETFKTGLFSVTVTGPNGFSKSAEISISEDFESFESVCSKPILEVYYYMDDNQNGVQDSNEADVLSGEKYIVLSPKEDYFALDGSRREVYVLQNKKYNFEDIHPNLDITNLPNNISFNEGDGTIRLDLGLFAVNATTSARTDLTSGAIERCNFVVPFQITIKNTGTDPYNGTVGISFDPLMELIGTNLETSLVSDDFVSWDIDIENHGQELTINLLMKMPEEEYTGELFCIMPLFDGSEKSNDEYCFVLRCAIDPNDKHGTPFRGNRNLTLFDEEIKYTIRFENLGNDTAFNIRVEDQLSEFVDINTYRFIQSSHDVTRQFVDINNKVIFDFKNIELPSAEQDSVANKGFVQFAIQSKIVISEGTMLENTAEIFFDFNDAIVTNTTEHTLVSSLGTTSIPNTISDLDISIFPNPMDDKINLIFDSSQINIKSYYVTDVIGNRNAKKSYTSKSLDYSYLNSGYYLLYLETTKNEVKVIPFIKK